MDCQVLNKSAILSPLHRQSQWWDSNPASSGTKAGRAGSCFVPKALRGGRNCLGLVSAPWGQREGPLGSLGWGGHYLCWGRGGGPWGGGEGFCPGALHPSFSLECPLCVRHLPGPSQGLNPLTLSAGPRQTSAKEGQELGRRGLHHIPHQVSRPLPCLKDVHATGTRMTGKAAHRPAEAIRPLPQAL